MSRKRNPENRGLPARWRYYHGAYYYRVPPGQEHHWDGKTQFRLGAKLSEAYRVWAERMEADLDAKTVGDLLDRYALEVVPTKALASQPGNQDAIRRLKKVFGQMRLATPQRKCLIEPHHAYTYFDRRKARNSRYSGKTAALREVEILRHALTKATEWGYISQNPLIGQVQLRGRKPQGRDRYVEDWEILEALSLSSRRKKGSVRMIQAYIRLKLLTGLRRTDLLWLRIEDIKEDGIHVQPSKTETSTRAKLIIERSPELDEAVTLAKAARPVDIGPYLFCNRRGEPYIREDNAANGFESIWQRFMARVIAETKVEQTFAERDLRAKAATDADSLEHAKQLLAHADERTTKQWYIRKPTIVKPGRGVKESDAE